MISIDHGGKVALVTGSGAGIDARSPDGLRRLEHTSSSTTSGATTPMRSSPRSPTQVDQRRPSSPTCETTTRVDAMVEGIVERHGRLDIAVNNVGMYPPGRMPKPFTAGRGDDYREIFDQNLVLAALCGRAEAEAMSETGGVILFVSSGETTRPAPFTSIYAAAKAGLNHLVTSMAVEPVPQVSGCSPWRPAPPAPRWSQPRTPKSASRRSPIDPAALRRRAR